MRLIMTCPTLTSSNQLKPTRSSYFTLFKSADFSIIITFSNNPELSNALWHTLLSRGLKMFLHRVVFHFKGHTNNTQMLR